MPAFLHDPIADGRKVAELVATRAEEGQYLEFKPNLKDSDCEKEVAALANAFGGDLVIGVFTTRDPTINRDRASGWPAAPKKPFTDKDLRQRLQNGLVPREVADTV